MYGMSSSIESLSFNGESSKAGENRSQDDVDRREGANEQSNDQGDVDGGGGAGDNDNVDDDDAPTALTPTTRAALPVDDAIARIEASSTPQKDLHRRLFEDFPLEARRAGVAQGRRRRTIRPTRSAAHRQASRGGGDTN